MKKFSIVVANLDPTVGHEVQETRPCVILSPDVMNSFLKTIVVAPITSTERKIPTRVLLKSTPQSGLSNDSYAMLDQIKTIDKTGVLKQSGSVSEMEKQALTDVLQDLFAM